MLLWKMFPCEQVHLRLHVLNYICFEISAGLCMVLINRPRVAMV